ncbi:hypothetical protein F5Y16DRAFT_4632 [Xylariaceae sp. FL0255]|nr:hypothetical protein F5Y16DRAFT_4632 [Xylariaceae sp. FL0255]
MQGICRWLPNPESIGLGLECSAKLPLYALQWLKDKAECNIGHLLGGPLKVRSMTMPPHLMMTKADVPIIGTCQDCQCIPQSHTRLTYNTRQYSLCTGQIYSWPLLIIHFHLTCESHFSEIYTAKRSHQIYRYLIVHPTRVPEGQYALVSLKIEYTFVIFILNQLRLWQTLSISGMPLVKLFPTTPEYHWGCGRLYEVRVLKHSLIRYLLSLLGRC